MVIQLGRLKARLRAMTASVDGDRIPDRIPRVDRRSSHGVKPLGKTTADIKDRAHRRGLNDAKVVAVILVACEPVRNRRGVLSEVRGLVWWSWKSWKSLGSLGWLI